jgi:sugar lactone lactonase YvrE
MIEVIGEHADLVGECPLWDGRNNSLFWIDIEGWAVRRRSAAGDTESRRLGGRPGSIALTDDEDVLLAAVEHQVGWLDWDSGTFTPWVDVEEAGGPNRLNDGRCDPAGAFWVGSMYEPADAGIATGKLHRVDPSGARQTSRTGIGISNGLAFSPDGTVMYFADTTRAVVWAYDYDAAAGECANERVFTDFSDLPGRPDGACVDEDGGYWTSCVFGSAVARLTPEGVVDRIIEVPVSKPTMPAFGGAGLETMFVTSIGGGGSHARPDPPGANGRLLAIDVGARGLPEPHFGGGPASTGGGRRR